MEIKKTTINPNATKEPDGVIEIAGLEFRYFTEKDFVKDGHVFCKACGEQLDKPPMLDKFIFRRNCKCDREEEEKRQAQQRAEDVRRLKKECFRTCKTLMDCSFDKIYAPEREEVVIAKNFVKNFKKLADENCGLLFHGNVGTGKTYLAAAIANAVMEEYMVSVKVRNIPQIINEIENGGFDIDKNEFYERLASVKLLVLDDFGIERNTPYVNELVYRIIDSRYGARKPTIISTNIPLNVLMNGSGDVEKERIYSRIREMCIPVKIVGDDLRREIGRNKMKDAKAILFGKER